MIILQSNIHRVLKAEEPQNKCIYCTKVKKLYDQNLKCIFLILGIQLTAAKNNNFTLCCKVEETKREPEPVNIVKEVTYAKCEIKSLLDGLLHTYDEIIPMSVIYVKETAVKLKSKTLKSRWSVKDNLLKLKYKNEPMTAELYENMFWNKAGCPSYFDTYVLFGIFYF